MSIILEQCEICDKLIECNDHSIELGFVCCDSCYNRLMECANYGRGASGDDSWGDSMLLAVTHGIADKKVSQNMIEIGGILTKLGGLDSE